MVKEKIDRGVGGDGSERSQDENVRKGETMTSGR